MSDFKDLFSGHAEDYQRYRPSYPEALFAFLEVQCQAQEHAWDCATGNGQAASQLAKHFTQVTATDASSEQLLQATLKDNINYYQAPAEASQLADSSVDLVTVAQAMHWFDFEKFFKEVARVLKPEGLICAFGYNKVVTGIKAIDELYHYFCCEYLWEKGCWAQERQYVEVGYDEVQWPFQDIEHPSFKSEFTWTYQDYLNYLHTWSAVKTHIKKYDDDPVLSIVATKLKDLWPVALEQPIALHFPIFMRLGRNAC